MTRATTPSATRPAGRRNGAAAAMGAGTPPAGAEAGVTRVGAATGAGQEASFAAASLAGAEEPLRWAREAFAASIQHTRSLVSMMEAVQQAQTRAWLDALQDAEQALVEMEQAEDTAELVAVPGRWSGAQWQHTLERTGAIASRVLEIESAWLRDVQDQALQRFSALGMAPAAMVPGEDAAAPGLAPARGAQADAAASWQQWIEQWDRGMGEVSRTWTEALRQVQPR